MKPCYNNEKEEWTYIQIYLEQSKNDQNYQNVVPSVTNEVGSLFPGLAALPQVNSIVAHLLLFSPIFFLGGCLNIWRVCLIQFVLLFKWSW